MAGIYALAKIISGQGSVRHANFGTSFNFYKFQLMLPPLSHAITTTILSNAKAIFRSYVLYR